MHKDINFYDGLKDVKVKQTVSPAVVVLSLLIVFSAGLIALSAYSMRYLNNAVYAEADAIHNFLADKGNQSLAQETLQKQSVAGLYKQYADITGKAYEDYYSLPFADSGSFALVTAAMPEDMKVLSFTLQNGNLILECQSKSETTPAAFVNAVKKTGLFVDVAYNGYVVGSKGEVLFTVTCTQKGGNIAR